LKRIFANIKFRIKYARKSLLGRWNFYRLNAGLYGQKQKLLVVRLDGIGDYILFRNFFSSLKKQRAYKMVSITLLGNIAFKDLAESFDRHFIDEFIWMDPALLYQEKSGLFLETQRKIKSKNFTIIINPVHSRTLKVDEFISGLGGRLVLGSVGDSINYSSPNEYQIGSRKYDFLIPVMGPQHFELYRNQDFFQKLTRSECKPELNLSLSKEQVPDKNKVVIFPGAGHKSRQWSPQNFASLINHLNEYKKPPLNFVLCGSAADKEICTKILKEVTNPANVVDLSGNTSLEKLATIISSAQLLVSNETSAVHIAAATKTPAVCISNGNHFGRFNPYPKEVFDKIVTVYPDNVFYNKDEYDFAVKQNKLCSSYDINSIKIEQVYQSISRLIN